MFPPIFSRRGLTIDRLLAFLEVANAGNFTLAAPGDPSRQSQLNRQVSELEAVCGVALTERRGKTIRLTADGNDLARVVRVMVSGVGDFAAKATGGAINVTVGAGGSIIHWWITPLHRVFSGAQIEVTTLSSPEIVEGLLDAQLHLGFVRGYKKRPGLQARVLATTDYALYVPKQLIPKGKNLGIKELVQQLPIGALTGEPGFSAVLDATFLKAKIVIEPVFRCETFPQLCRAVSFGWCAAVLPTLARDDLPPGEFNEYRDPLLGDHDGRMSLVWSSRLEQQRPHVAALIPGIVKGIQSAVLPK
jgi:DNA-binding transcriptional LysR family regulator